MAELGTGRLSSNAGVTLQHIGMRSEIWPLWGAHKQWIHQHTAQMAEHIPAPPAGNIFCMREERVGKTALVYSVRMLVLSHRAPHGE